MLNPLDAILAGRLLTLAIALLVPLTSPVSIVRAEQEPPETVPERGRRPVSPETPLRVAFRLSDGVRLSGHLTAWSDEFFDGSFGRRRWTELMSADAETILRQLIDAEAAPDWVLVGEIMLELQDERRAERAFRRALDVDGEASPLIDEARARVEKRRAEREAQQKIIEAQRLRTMTPEGLDWPVTHWPALSVAEQQAALAAVRGEADRILEEAGTPLSPVNSQFFLVYSDLDRRETAQWARRLDLLYRQLSRLLYWPEQQSIFRGKAVVFIFKDRDLFRLVEAQAFDHLTPRSVGAIMHPRDQLVFINTHFLADERAFGAALLRQATYAFMHCYITPRRLPAWANDGLADYMAATLLQDSIIDEKRRPLALRFVRSGGNVGSLLELTYRDAAWPGRDEIGPAVGHLMVELMILQHQARFVGWIASVKSGKPWEEALQQDYGMAKGPLIGLFTQYYTVND
jgi:hypothetical protein